MFYSQEGHLCIRPGLAYLIVSQRGQQQLPRFKLTVKVRRLKQLAPLTSSGP